MKYDELRADTRDREEALYYADTYFGDVSRSGESIGEFFSDVDDKLDKLIDIHDREGIRL